MPEKKQPKAHPSSRRRRRAPDLNLDRVFTDLVAEQRYRRRGLLPPGHAVDEMRTAYYEVIQEDAEFVAALRKLYARLFPDLARLRLDADFKTLDPAKVTAKRLAAVEKQNRRGSTIEDDRLVRAFSARWALPRGADQDIWMSFFATNEGAPLRLRAIWRGGLRPDLPAFDPLAGTPREADARLRVLRDRARATGWAALAPWHRDPEQRRRLAWRLYWCAVKKLSPAQIKREEEARKWPVTSSSAIRSSVLGWVKTLGIERPAMDRPSK